MDQMDLFVAQFTLCSEFNCRRSHSGHFPLALEEISLVASQKAEISTKGCELRRRTDFLANQVVFQ